MKKVLHVFRAIAREKIELDISDLVRYCGKHKNLDLHLLQIFDLLHFSINIFSGAVKKKLTLLEFFELNGAQIL
jgi:hypothetical protein